MITAIAFDVMDTLVRDPFREALVAATGRTLAELSRVRDRSAYPAFERGELDEEAYWATYVGAGVPVDPVAFHRVRRAGIRWLPGMRALLADLDGLVLRATASNYPHWIEELAATHLDSAVDEVIASCHLGVRKPESAFFRALLERLDRSADEVLFLDDREGNVEAAQAVGLRAHRFTDAGSARSWIAAQGVDLVPAQG